MCPLARIVLHMTDSVTGFKKEKRKLFVAGALIGAAVLAGCGTTIPADQQGFIDQVTAAVSEGELQQYLTEAKVSDQTWDLPTEVQPTGTRIVLYNKSKNLGFSNDARAVVYRITDGVAIIDHVCLIKESDLQHTVKTGKYSRITLNPITDSIDDQTTEVYCQTPQQAGDQPPRLVVVGKSDGVFGIGGGHDETKYFGR